jgi:4-hydroxy-2-oxoheptanedioate aldolase
VRLAPRRIRSKLASDLKVYGIAVQLPSAEIVEIVGYDGYDFAWIDAEHGSLDYSELREFIRAADAAGIDALVRLESRAAEPIAQVLDLGAAGSIAPRRPYERGRAGGCRGDAVCSRWHSGRV